MTLRNDPSALGLASNAIGALGVNVLSGWHTALPAESEATWSFFAQLTDNVTPEQVAEALKRLKVVTDVAFGQAQLPGLIVDELHFPLLVLGERAVVFKVRTLARIFTRLREMSGASVAKVLRHQMGLEAGEEKARRVQERFNLAGQDALRLILAERVAKGWGIPVILKYDAVGKEAQISVAQSFECAEAEQRVTEPAGEFLRGYLEGILSVLMKTRIQVREVECLAKGHPQCSFEATKANA